MTNETQGGGFDLLTFRPTYTPFLEQRDGSKNTRKNAPNNYQETTNEGESFSIYLFIVLLFNKFLVPHPEKTFSHLISHN